MLHWLLSLFVCQHAHRYQERIKGRLMLTCDRCGEAKPALSRTDGELRKFKRLKPAHETMRAKPTTPARVLPMVRTK